MHNESRRRRINNYAKILIVFSIALLVYGVILDTKSEHHLIDPVKDVETPQNDSNTVTISTIDEIEDSNSTEEKPVPQNNVVNPPAPSDVPLTIVDQNNQLKAEILSKYGVTVKYGSETQDYVVSSSNNQIGTEPITDPATINNQLIRLRDTLSLYPEGMFLEIKNGGIPLTVYLVEKFSNPGVTGITDSSYSFAHISIAAIYPFEESFFHESYHYIERYLFKKGASFNGWEMLNPEGFQYGTISNEQSYNMTFLANSPFVNNYAQSADTEDRASTFEYMMAPSKASCLNKDTTVWAKAKYIALMIETTLRCVTPETTEYWERYL